MWHPPEAVVRSIVILAVLVGCSTNGTNQREEKEKDEEVELIDASPRKLDFGRIVVETVAKSHLCLSSPEKVTLSTSSPEIILGDIHLSRVSVSFSATDTGNFLGAIFVRQQITGKLVQQVPVEAIVYAGLRPSPSRISVDLENDVDFRIVDRTGNVTNAEFALSDSLDIQPKSDVEQSYRLRIPRDTRGDSCLSLKFISFQRGSDSGVLPVSVWHSDRHARPAHDVNCPVVITEFMADNRATTIDADGESSDWLELHNRSDRRVNLKGWSLTDDLEKKRKWVFPSVVLSPSERILVFASGKNRTQPELHTSFRLKKGGESLALYTAKGILSAQFFDCFPTQHTDYSFGFEESESGADQLTAPVFFPVPTPGHPNSLGIFGPPPTPQLTCEEIEGEQQRISLGGTPLGATIRYTLDGSRPSEVVGSFYRVPVVCDAGTPFQAITTVQGCMPSGIVSRRPKFTFNASSSRKQTRLAKKWGQFDATYGLSLDVNTEQDREGAQQLTAAIFVDPYDFFGPSGIYVNAERRGQRFERSALFFPPTTNGSSSAIDTRIRIHGGGSRYESPKKSFRLHLSQANRPEHLSRVLVLRGGFNDSFCANQTVGENDLLRDEFARRCHRDMGYLTPSGSFVELFLNQDYWGLYNLVPRINDEYIAGEIGGKKSEVAVINSSGIQSGTAKTWNDLLGLVDSRARLRLSTLSSLLDIDAFIDYVTLNWYLGNGDWPHTNWIAYHQNAADAKVRFLVWDAESTLESLYINCVDDVPVKPCPIGSMLTCLLDDGEFRERFQLRARALLTEGKLAPASSMARYATLAEEVRDSIRREIARWAVGYQGRATDLETLDSVHSKWLKTVDYRLNTYFFHRSRMTLTQIEEVLNKQEI